MAETDGVIKENDQIVMGSIFSLLSCLCLAVMNAFVKMASVSASTGIIIFCQFLISFLLVLPFALSNKKGGIKTKSLGLHFLRALFGAGAAYGLFFAITLVPLTEAVLLVYSAPLWMTALAWLFFKEKVTLLVWLGVFIGFIGVGLILHPSLHSVNLGTILATLGGISMAVAFLTVRTLNKTEPTARILFYYFGISTIVALPFFLHAFHGQKFPLLTWFYILSIGITQVLSQAFMVIAYRYARPVKLSPFIYTVIVFTAVIDYVFWKEVLTPVKYLGVILVVAGGIFAMIHSTQGSLKKDRT